MKAPRTPFRAVLPAESQTPSSPARATPFAQPSLLPVAESDIALEGFGSYQNLGALDSVPEFKRFKGTRQASLHDWCQPIQGERQSKSLDLIRPVKLSQDIDLTPPGSPKLTMAGPLFPPRLSRKGRSRSVGKVVRQDVVRELNVGRDVLTELLSCDESLVWTACHT